MPPNGKNNMEQATDIRWIQRYANYHKACGRLLAVTEADRFIGDLSELELEGLVHRLVFILTSYINMLLFNEIQQNYTI